MAGKETFDFTEFLANVADADDDTKRDILRSEVDEEMQSVMGEVAPRLWSVIQEQMLKDPKNSIYLNAVINASIFAVLSWVAACTPEGESNGRDNDKVLREKIMMNVDNALANAREGGPHMSQIAHSVGKLKLMEDAMAGLAKQLTQNSMIIQGVHKTIQNFLKPDS